MGKKLLVVAALSVVAVVMLAGFGPGRGAHGDPKKAYRFISFKVDSVLDDIKATDAQRQQVNAVKEELWQEGLKLKSGQDLARQALIAQWEAPTVDRTKVHAAVDERVDAFRAFAHRIADAAIQVHGLLSPEQRAELKAQIPNRGEP